jgi:hypothetical protein
VEAILKVARVVPRTNGHEVGAVFVHITRADRRRLRTYLTAVQASDAPAARAVLSSPPTIAVD